MGLGVSGCLMSTFSAFALWHPAERIATMNGIAFASGMLGAIMVTVPLEIVLRALQWREVFRGIVALTVAVSLVLYIVVPEKAAARARAARFGAIARVCFDRCGMPHSGASHCASVRPSCAVSLGTLWVATWLRDVGGYAQAEVARALLAFNLVMLTGYLGFGRIGGWPDPGRPQHAAAARRRRRGRLAVPRPARAGSAQRRRVPLVRFFRLRDRGGAVLCAVLAPLPEGDGGARQYAR